MMEFCLSCGGWHDFTECPDRKKGSRYKISKKLVSQLRRQGVCDEHDITAHYAMDEIVSLRAQIAKTEAELAEANAMLDWMNGDDIDIRIFYNSDTAEGIMKLYRDSVTNPCQGHNIRELLRSAMRGGYVRGVKGT